MSTKAFTAVVNGQFIKCGKCKVNIPRQDVENSKICTICGEELTWEENLAEQMPKQEQKKKKMIKRRWVQVETNKGKIYYHNSETGQDTWTKPPDFDAPASNGEFGT